MSSPQFNCVPASKMCGNVQVCIISLFLFTLAIKLNVLYYIFFYVFGRQYNLYCVKGGGGGGEGLGEDVHHTYVRNT